MRCRGASNSAAVARPLSAGVRHRENPPAMNRPYLLVAFAAICQFGASPPVAAQTRAEIAKAQVSAKVKVTATEYDRLYAVNEIAAERRFHLQMIVLTEDVMKVSRTPDGQFPLLFLAGHPSAGRVVLAALNPGAEARAASLKPPEKVRLLCVGGERVEAIATLNLCSFALTDTEIRQAQAGEVDEDTVRAWSRIQLSTWFKCPESYASEEESRRDFGLSIVWLQAQGSPVTVESIQEFRSQLLREHRCANP